MNNLKTTKKEVKVFLFILAFLGVVFLANYDKTKKEKQQIIQEQIRVQNSFIEKCPISISGYIWQNDKNSSISISIKNNSDYTVSAVNFIFQCYDVYGDEMTYSPYKATYKKYCIDSGKNKNIEYVIPKYTKSVKIYVYNVYYKNNYQKEWGTRDISLKEVYLYAPVTYVEYTR